jgi:hypothetical protein
VNNKFKEYEWKLWPNLTHNHKHTCSRGSQPVGPHLELGLERHSDGLQMFCQKQLIINQQTDKPWGT